MKLTAAFIFICCLMQLTLAIPSTEFRWPSPSKTTAPSSSTVSLASPSASSAAFNATTGSDPSAAIKRSLVVLWQNAFWHKAKPAVNTLLQIFSEYSVNLFEEQGNTTDTEIAQVIWDIRNRPSKPTRTIPLPLPDEEEKPVPPRRQADCYFYYWDEQNAEIKWVAKHDFNPPPKSYSWRWLDDTLDPSRNVDKLVTLYWGACPLYYRLFSMKRTHHTGDVGEWSIDWDLDIARVWKLLDLVNSSFLRVPITAIYCSLLALWVLNFTFDALLGTIFFSASATKQWWSTSAHPVVSSRLVFLVALLADFVNGPIVADLKRRSQILGSIVLLCLLPFWQLVRFPAVCAYRFCQLLAVVFETVCLLAGYSIYIVFRIVVKAACWSHWTAVAHALASVVYPEDFYDRQTAAKLRLDIDFWRFVCLSLLVINLTCSELDLDYGWSFSAWRGSFLYGLDVLVEDAADVDDDWVDTDGTDEDDNDDGDDDEGHDDDDGTPEVEDLTTQPFLPANTPEIGQEGRKFPSPATSDVTTEGQSHTDESRDSAVVAQPEEASGTVEAVDTDVAAEAAGEGNAPDGPTHEDEVRDEDLFGGVVDPADPNADLYAAPPSIEEEVDEEEMLPQEELIVVMDATTEEETTVAEEATAEEDAATEETVSAAVADLESPAGSSDSSSSKSAELSASPGLSSSRWASQVETPPAANDDDEPAVVSAQPASDDASSAPAASIDQQVPETPAGSTSPASSVETVIAPPSPVSADPPAAQPQTTNEAAPRSPSPPPAAPTPASAPPRFAGLSSSKWSKQVINKPASTGRLFPDPAPTPAAAPAAIEETVAPVAPVAASSASVSALAPASVPAPASGSAPSSGSPSSSGPAASTGSVASAVSASGRTQAQILGQQARDRQVASDFVPRPAQGGGLTTSRWSTQAKQTPAQKAPAKKTPANKPPLAPSAPAPSALSPSAPAFSPAPLSRPRQQGGLSASKWSTQAKETSSAPTGPSSSGSQEVAPAPPARADPVVSAPETATPAAPLTRPRQQGGLTASKWSTQAKNTTATSAGPSTSEARVPAPAPPARADPVASSSSSAASALASEAARPSGLTSSQWSDMVEEDLAAWAAADAASPSASAISAGNAGPKKPAGLGASKWSQTAAKKPEEEPKRAPPAASTSSKPAPKADPQGKGKAKEVEEIDDSASPVAQQKTQMDKTFFSDRYGPLSSPELPPQTEAEPVAEPSTSSQDVASASASASAPASTAAPTSGPADAPSDNAGDGSDYGSDDGSDGDSDDGSDDEEPEKPADGKAPALTRKQKANKRRKKLRTYATTMRREQLLGALREHEHLLEDGSSEPTTDSQNGASASTPTASSPAAPSPTAAASPASAPPAAAPPAEAPPTEAPPATAAPSADAPPATAPPADAPTPATAETPAPDTVADSATDNLESSAAAPTGDDESDEDDDEPTRKQKRNRRRLEARRIKTAWDRGDMERVAELEARKKEAKAKAGKGKKAKVKEETAEEKEKQADGKKKGKKGKKGKKK